ncbi:MAG: hypothetical protein QOE30_4552 [Mycobacterium sp.]|nr:hypothetical protein [Mycobacterium sp.]
MLVREAHDILLSGSDPGAEAHGIACFSPAIAEPIEDLLGLSTIGVDQHEQELVAADTEGHVLLPD